jgi:hypothetical protein
LEQVGRTLVSPHGALELVEALGWEQPPGGALPGFSTIRFPALFAQLDTTRKNLAAAQIAAGDGPVSVSLNLGYADLFLRVRDVLSDLNAAGNALGALPADYLAQTQIQTQFLPRLLNVVVVWLAANRPTFYQALRFLGVIQFDHMPADDARYQVEHDRPSIRFERLGSALTNPSALLRDLFGWGLPTFSAGGLLFTIAEFLHGLGARFQMRFLTPEDEQLILGRAVPEADTDPLPQIQLNLLQGTVDSRFEVGLLLSALRPTAAGAADGGVSFGPLIRGTTDQTFSLPGDWNLEFASPLDLDAGVAVFQRASQPATLVVDLRDGRKSASSNDNFSVNLRYSPPNTPRPLLVIPGGSRLEYRQLVATLGARGATGGAELFIEIGLQGGGFVLSLEEAGDLLQALMPKDLGRADFDFALGFASGHAYLRGSASLQVVFPVNLSLGPVELQSVTIALSPGAGGAIPIEASTTLQTTFGPLSMVVERIGLIAAFNFVGNNGGNLGPLNVDLNFKVPSGIGLSIDVGPVSGGGYLSLDPAGNRYAGALDLKLSFVHVTGYGIYEQTHDGKISFVAVIGVRFNPGIQLGFGFELTGVGGLIGQNRQANADLLRERLASGAAGNVLFCDDPIRNAPTLLGDLASFFPAASSGFLIGPTLQISWLSPIVRLDVGIILQFPGPSKILLLGSLRAMIGFSEDAALLFVRMDFLGSIEFDKQLVAFDAQLVNSQALGIFRLTGGTALRLNYGDSPYIVLTVGGFNPRFDPGPLNLPPIPRVGASLDVSFIAQVYLRLEMYVAFTSNTLQAGAHVQAGMELGPFSADGHFDFDALIQFRPFLFDASFGAGFSVEAFGVSFASVDVEGRISGPGPIVIHAEGSVRRLGIKVSGSATFELGDHDADRVDSIPSVVKALEPELSNLANLRTSGTDNGVILKSGSPPVAGVLISPKGTLIWEQKRAPLNTIIQRLEGTPLDGPHELHLAAPAGWTASNEQDWFSPGTFAILDLQASQTLNNAGFEQLPSGLQVGSSADIAAPTTVDSPMTIDLFKRPVLSRILNFTVGSYMSAALTSGLRQRGTTPAVQSGGAKVTVSPETSDVYDSSGAAVQTRQTSFQAFQVSRQADGRVAVPSADMRIAL